jgi:hypothetical protein
MFTIIMTWLAYNGRGSLMDSAFVSIAMMVAQLIFGYLNLLTGLFTIIIALYNSLILTCTSVFLLSFVITMDDIIYESIVMLLTDSRYRGRIKGLQVSIAVLLMPVAMLFGGYIGDLVGVRNLIIISSAFVFLATIICFANKHARSVYSRYEHTVNLFRYLYLESWIKRTKNFLTGSYHLFKRMLD